MTFSLFQFATSKLVPNKAMVPACIMQLQKTQAKHQSRLVVRTYTISDIYDAQPLRKPAKMQKTFMFSRHFLGLKDSDYTTMEREVLEMVNTGCARTSKRMTYFLN